MQDDDKASPAPDDTAPPSSHEHMNRPGMTNGIPDQAGDAQATGGPPDDRQQTETAARNSNRDADEDAEGGPGS